MAVIDENILQTVQTYQKADLARLLNDYVAINIANKKFKDFQNKPANLGDTVTFDLAPRAQVANGLVVTRQPSVQRKQNLACTQAANSTSDFSDQQFIFNVSDYMDRFGESRIAELGTEIESDLLLNIISQVRVTDPRNTNFGTILDPTSGPYRFYGNGVTAIDSFTQLATAIAGFNDYGAAKNNLCGLIPVVDVPRIVGSGLNQFATRRNDDIAESWELGPYSKATWYESNLLPIHTAGTVGEEQTVLTLVSTNDPTGVNVTSLTFSGAGTDANAFKVGDLFQFNDDVSGQDNIRFRTFIGHKVSQQPVQVRVTADAASSGGNVTVSIYPALVSAPTLNQNLSIPLQAGMQITALPSHRAGCIMSGNPLYMAMPMLPDQEPFSTVVTMDKDSGASIRNYWGTILGQAEKIYVYDAIWGSTMVAENTLRMIFPL